MQFGRYETKTRKSIPNEWIEEVTKTLTEVYFEQSEKDNSFFDVYGEIVDKEFVVVVSYLHHDELMASPISVFLSHDVLENSKEFQSALKNLIDLAGEIYDDIFAQDEWQDYNPNWTESKYKNSDFFYKITRENISLTLQSEEILEKDALTKLD